MKPLRGFPMLKARGWLWAMVAGLSGTPCWMLAADWPQWRGAQRNGISSETGLLQEWPEGGPKELWRLADLGGGYSTPSVAGGRLFVMSNEGMGAESVHALAPESGKRFWSIRLGKVGPNDARMNYAGARSTPTVDGALVYALGSDGDLACLEAESGAIRWQKNIRAEFDGKPGSWAYAESPLIDGNRVVCTPGGAEATLIALDKRTGSVLWKCALPEADEAAYSSPIVIEADGIRQYVQLVQKGLVGVEASSGKLLWRYGKPVSRFNANIPTPVAAEGLIYAASAGTGGGTVKLISRDGSWLPEPLYFEAKLPTAIGGSVVVGKHLYGTTAQAMLCVELGSGQIAWEERALGAAALCYADGRLYLHAETGAVALLEPSPQGYREKGRFTPAGRPQRANAMEKAWAHPVVSNGRLYIRDLAVLWCYDVRRAR